MVVNSPSPASPPSAQAGRHAVATIGIGVDLVKIPRMRDVITRWDERFLKRVFTDAEIAYCRADRFLLTPGGV